DVVFLDVQMPGLDGFGVVDALAGGQMPHVVFVTAYDAYAVRAFEAHAVDYLLKPFSPERIAKALARVKARLHGGLDDGLHRRLRELLAMARPGPAYLERLLVQDGPRAILLDVARIDWIEAERNYVRLHVGDASHLVRGTLTALEERLDPTRLIRILQTRIVNTYSVSALLPRS